jgi:hypothetical protein
MTTILSHLIQNYQKFNLDIVQQVIMCGGTVPPNSKKQQQNKQILK